MDSYIRCDYVNDGIPMSDKELFVMFDAFLRNPSYYFVKEKNVIHASGKVIEDGSCKGFLKVKIDKKYKSSNKARIEIEDNESERRAKRVVRLSDVLDENMVKKELVSRICKCVSMIG